MLEPLGSGTVVRCPAAFVIVSAVSSATLFGMLCTGGNMRRVSYRTLLDTTFSAGKGRGGRDARDAVGERAEVFVFLRDV